MAKREEKSPCERCGRVSYTVRGICTECGAVKDYRKATAFRRRPPSGGPSVFDPLGCFFGCFPWVLVFVGALIWLAVARRRPAQR